MGELDVVPTSTIKQVKEMITVKPEIPVENMRLLRDEGSIFGELSNKNQLEDQKTLSDLGCVDTTPGEFPKGNYFYLVVAKSRRRLTNQSLIDRFIRESIR